MLEKLSNSGAICETFTFMVQITSARLLYAARMGNMARVQELIENELADVNAIDEVCVCCICAQYMSPYLCNCERKHANNLGWTSEKCVGVRCAQ